MRGPSGSKGAGPVLQALEWPDGMGTMEQEPEVGSLFFLDENAKPRKPERPGTAGTARQPVAEGAAFGSSAAGAAGPEASGETGNGGRRRPGEAGTARRPVAERAVFGSSARGAAGPGILATTRDGGRSSDDVVSSAAGRLKPSWQKPRVGRAEQTNVRSRGRGAMSSESEQHQDSAEEEEREEREEGGEGEKAADVLTPEVASRVMVHSRLNRFLRNTMAATMRHNALAVERERKATVKAGKLGKRAKEREREQQALKESFKGKAAALQKVNKAAQDAENAQSVRFKRDLEAGHKPYLAWHKEKKRQRALLHRVAMAKRRAAERIQLEKEWYEKYEAEDTPGAASSSSKPVGPFPPRKGKGKGKRFLTEEAMKEFRQEPEDETPDAPLPRSWKKPKHMKANTPEAKAKKHQKWRARRKATKRLQKELQEQGAEEAEEEAPEREELEAEEAEELEAEEAEEETPGCEAQSAEEDDQASWEEAQRWARDAQREQEVRREELAWEAANRAAEEADEDDQWIATRIAEIDEEEAEWARASEAEREREESEEADYNLDHLETVVAEGTAFGPSAPGGPGGSRLNVVIDSGACTCALPLSMATEYKVHHNYRAGTKPFYRTASGQEVAVEGCRSPVVRLQNGKEARMNFIVMDVKRPLASVSQMVQAGHRVVFDSEANGGAYIEDRANNCWHKVYERDGVYVLPTWVVPPARQQRQQLEEDRALASFGRQD